MLRIYINIYFLSSIFPQKSQTILYLFQDLKKENRSMATVA